MFNGPPIGFCFGSTFDPGRFCFDYTSDINNLMCSIDGCDIFVDYVDSGQLFVDSYFILKTFLNSLTLMLMYVVSMCSVNFLILTFLWA